MITYRCDWCDEELDPDERMEPVNVVPIWHVDSQLQAIIHITWPGTRPKPSTSRRPDDPVFVDMHRHCYIAAMIEAAAGLDTSEPVEAEILDEDEPPAELVDDKPSAEELDPDSPEAIAERDLQRTLEQPILNAPNASHPWAAFWTQPGRRSPSRASSRDPSTDDPEPDAGMSSRMVPVMPQLSRRLSGSAADLPTRRKRRPPRSLGRRWRPEAPNMS